MNPQKNLTQTDWQAERSKYRILLRRGDFKAIATLAEVNIKTVYKWFRGDGKINHLTPYVKHYFDKREEEINQKIKNYEKSE